jgi:hypothetical protein
LNSLNVTADGWVRNNPTQAKRRLEWGTLAFVADKESTVISATNDLLLA